MVEIYCTCSHCGAWFIAHQKNKIYCSGRCKVAEWKKRNPEKNAINKACASKSAKEKLENKPKFTRVTFNVCANCSKPFVSMRKSLYCCKDCSPSAVKQKASSDYLSSRPCAICGKPCGYTFGRGKKYCSKNAQE